MSLKRSNLVGNQSLPRENFNTLHPPPERYLLSQLSSPLGEFFTCDQQQFDVLGYAMLLPVT